jgi:sugar transferase (PEP-CTERM/EpsH1 system associated)
MVRAPLLNTEEVAAFNSCSAYQTPVNILFLSHCVPNPPDKGEKIRAAHELNALAKKHRIHLACFARSEEEVAHAEQLKDRCASVFVEQLSSWRALAGAALRFGAGGCLNTAFYRSPRMDRHVESLRPRLAATLAYSSAVVQFAPVNVPLWFDMVDVDSEKWLEYGQTRWPGALYRLEGQRLRAMEASYASLAKCTFLTTPREQKILQDIAPQARVESLMNGVDFEFFNPSACSAGPDLERREYVVFVGSMEYFPNVDACCWFADSVFSELRSCRPNIEFFIVGRNPSQAVRRLANRPGIVVTGGVPDVRPYLAGARSMVAPLRIARGVQNKVLEALSMGKRVHASPAVASTFGEVLPHGVTICHSTADYLLELCTAAESPVSWDAVTRDQARTRFTWQQNLQPLVEGLDHLAARSMVSE